MVQGLEQLAAPSASFFFRTLHHFSITDPTSGILADLRRRYNRVFSSDWMDLRNLPIRHTITAAHLLVDPRRKPLNLWESWEDDRPSAQEHIQLAWGVVGAAQESYEPPKSENRSNWTLRFALDSLSLDPPPPPSVVADCLKVIAINLGCDLPNTTTPDERCVQF